MYGTDVRSLVLYTSTKTNPMTEVNRLSGEKGNQWFKLDTDIGAIPTNQEWMRIIIEGVVGEGATGKKKFFLMIFSSYFFKGDIAVDDISWMPNVPCGPEETTTTTTNAPIIPTTYRKYKSFRKKKHNL
jgi:hypothetical protein